MSITLVILAAGIGSRYGGLKQMEPVGPSGEFLIDYAVYDALRAGFKKVVFVIRKDIQEAFCSAIEARLGEHVPAEHVFQESFNLPQGYFIPLGRKKPWGTGHAVLSCAEIVQEPFAVINADDFYGRESYAAVARFLAETAANSGVYGMVGFRVSETLSAHGSVARGVCRTRQDNTLESIIERTGIERSDGQIRYALEPSQWGYLSGKELVSLNMWGFKPGIFEYLRDEFRLFLDSFGKSSEAEFMIPTVVNKLISERKVAVKVLGTSSSWFGVTNPADKDTVTARIRALVDSGEYPSNLWE